MWNLARVYKALALLLLVSFYHASSETHIPSGIVEGRWTKRNSPYCVHGNIQIPRGKKLAIEAGVRVVFDGQYHLVVRGILVARGSEGDSIYFFPSDTAVGWCGIGFLKSEHGSALEYCVLTGGRIPLTEDMSQPTADSGLLAAPRGGAVLIDESDPIVARCEIAGNLAPSGGGVAIVSDTYSILSDRRVMNNRARPDNGGGIGVTTSRPVIVNCLIVGNRARNMGGGIFSGGNNLVVIDSCRILNNVAELRGGGIAFYTNSKPVVRNSIIANNFSPLGGGIYVDEFYNKYREQPGKIDIQIVNVRIEHNVAEYGGGVWFRDIMGELKDATICNNRATIGGGVYIEHNPPHPPFSTDHLCNVYMNFARVMGNDFFRLGGEDAYVIPLDTFTVQHYSALNAEPIEKFILEIKNFKIPQVNADLYVGPDGDDAHSGLTKSDPLRTIRIAFLKILADSTAPRRIFLKKGDYVFSETNDLLMLAKTKYVSLDGLGFTDVILGTDRITVFTPWWISVWALMIYAVTLVTVITAVWNIRMKRVRMRNDLERERFEAQRLLELDDMKTQFFTNISHEFRTPLTLILGPAKQLLDHLTDEGARDKVDLIHRSGRKLAKLVDELLDFSKIEAGEMKLKACPSNLVAITREAALPFYAAAERRRTAFTVRAEQEEITAYVDKEKFDKILTNVLSNAFKFTPEGGIVEVEVRGKPDGFQQGVAPAKSVEISVRDSGIGIPGNELDKIFDRFYQVDGSHTRKHEGTGIGLALTKALVELHGGKIEVESEEGKGSTFRIIIPLGKDHLKPEEICEEEQLQEKEHPAPDAGEYIERQVEPDLERGGREQPELPTLLIVEDNADVRKYVRMILEKRYETFEAHDGEEGLQKAFERIPDLIVLDVMMPKLDGFQVCKRLKADSRTSHIPVVMLTAKATTKDKISGLEIGADAYITKPFEPDELEARIRNLLEQRKRIHEYFRKHGLFELQEQKITPVDQRFVQKAAEVIREHMSDPAFGVEAFAEDMCASRSLLLKKVEALTGESPSQLIRKARLKRAAELLAAHAGNIAQVALEVGFSNPAYFSECFRKEFGLTPSQYHHTVQNPPAG
jgi:signal transduction histidine kinase/DNA-binding NarL/FixJ family response regulator